MRTINKIVVIHIFFISKKDLLYFTVIWGSIALILISTILPFASTVSKIISSFIGLILSAFLLWIWFSTGYRIKNETVQIRCGPFHSTIPIQEIKKINKNKSVWSAAALAIDRLEIQYGKFNLKVLVSPKDEEEFICLLLKKNPHIELDLALS